VSEAMVRLDGNQIRSSMTEEYVVASIVSARVHQSREKRPNILESLERAAMYSFNKAIAKDGKEMIGLPSRQEKFFPAGQCLYCRNESEGKDMLSHWHYFWTVEAA